MVTGSHTWVEFLCETCDDDTDDTVFEVYGYLELVSLPDVGREVYFEADDGKTVRCPRDNGDHEHEVSLIGGG